MKEKQVVNFIVFLKFILSVQQISCRGNIFKRLLTKNVIIGEQQSIFQGLFFSVSRSVGSSARF